MGTATCRRAVALLGILPLGASGCGSQGETQGKQPGPRSPFAQLRAAPAPSAWRTATIASGAVLAYPPGWIPARGDPGTTTVILRDARDRILGYLNVTPRQGAETLANWPRFRVRHNAAEGDRGVRTEGSAFGVRFRAGTGSCVRDSYTTASGARYVELACLVAGARARSVIVAAAPPAAWARLSPWLYRALSAFST
jgi:hypothetical protein